MSPSRSAYDGDRRRIVLAFDIGTTYSGISYSILDPGHIPEIKRVTRFPAQETISGASKIPTVIYYDDEGKVRAVGAEATREETVRAALEEEWYKAEWFKLHLRSKVGDGKSLHQHVPPLPPFKSIIDLFSDFLQYLLSCVESYIKDTHPGGINLWNQAVAQDEVHFVLSHPNGWEGSEQAQMRKAVVKSGLIKDTHEGHSRVTFVTEGEASLHFAIENGGLSQASKGEGIVIVDAGGGTVDVSTYYRGSAQDSKKAFEEIAPPQCYFHGSVFITFRAKDYLKEHLSGSVFGTEDDVEDIAMCFDRTTKLRFRSPEGPQYIKFGATRDNDPTCGIRFGQLKLEGTQVEKFFKPSVDCIIQAVMEQRKTAHKNISHVILVGGFAASDYLFERVRAILSPRDLTVIRPENHVNKAVSDGAISFFLDHRVLTRVSKFTIGTDVVERYDPSKPDHRARAERKENMYYAQDGFTWIRKAFKVILDKNTPVSEETEFTRNFCQEVVEGVNVLRAAIYSYRGEAKIPRWVLLDEPENCSKLCTLAADISHIPKISKTNASGKAYQEMDFQVVLLFGLTEMKAMLQWTDNGVRKRSPAEMIFDNV